MVFTINTDTTGCLERGAEGRKMYLNRGSGMEGPLISRKGGTASQRSNKLTIT